MSTKELRELNANNKNEKRGAKTSINEFERSIESCYNLHLFILQLLADVVEYAKERQKIASNKLRPTKEDLNPNLRFVQNSTIGEIASNEALQQKLKEAGLSWEDNDEVIREIYNQIIASQNYQSYMDGASNDKDFTIALLSTLFEDNQILESALEDMSLYWADDLGYALNQCVRHIETCKANQILPMFNNDNDKEFGNQILLHAIGHNQEYLELIESYVENWDLERTAFMDRMIMVLALSEVVSCPTIPVKVSLDEYIEISKYYSTPQSSNFINGVLNKAIEALTKEGKVKKTGRGLIN